MIIIFVITSQSISTTTSFIQNRYIRLVVTVTRTNTSNLFICERVKHICVEYTRRKQAEVYINKDISDHYILHYNNDFIQALHEILNVVFIT